MVLDAHWFAYGTHWFSYGPFGLNNGWLDAPIGFEPKGNSSVLLPSQLHNQAVAVGYCVGIPVIAL